MMKQVLRAYKKTVSIVDETVVAMYEGIAKNKIGFLLESYDKNHDRFSFFGVEPRALLRSDGQRLIVTYNDGTKEV
ncbi:MAG: anthranilate synthase component I, partial [Lachnospiraceae bacterium]